MPHFHHLPWLMHIYLANPMANVVLAFQRALWPGGHTEQGAPFLYTGNLYGRLGILLVVCLVLLWLAQRIFARAQGNFAQELLTMSTPIIRVEDVVQEVQHPQGQEPQGTHRQRRTLPRARRGVLGAQGHLVRARGRQDASA